MPGRTRGRGGRLSASIAAGVIATLPMTAAMELGFHALPDRLRYALPPREVTDAVAEASGVPLLSERARVGAAFVAHFAYGGGAAVGFAALHPRSPGRAMIDGIAYGLMVWLVSYLGLLPAAGLLSPAYRHPTPRTALMIAAHIVWGACLGLVSSLLGRI